MMKLVVISSLLACIGLAAPLDSRAISFEFTNVPTGLNLTIGTEFTFTWEPQDSTETIQLAVAAWDPTPYAYGYNPYIGQTVPEYYEGGYTLADDVPLSAGSYTWTVQTITASQGSEPVLKGSRVEYNFQAVPEKDYSPFFFSNKFHVLDPA
ncbi:hypothetical protein GGR57DRAFT_160088 [Xylariaceae sp. FL1272]|nr:hypothetical protein GGR57DRAFT_160088 [Xylariaceae sp. FL1272]